MQRWEYMIVYVGGNQWIDSTGQKGRLSKIGSAAGPLLPIYAPMELLGTLGADGWEITGVASGRSDTYQLFLKRPKDG